MARFSILLKSPKSQFRSYAEDAHKPNEPYRWRYSKQRPNCRLLSYHLIFLKCNLDKWAYYLRFSYLQNENYKQNEILINNKWSIVDEITMWPAINNKNKSAEKWKTSNRIIIIIIIISKCNPIVLYAMHTKLCWAEKWKRRQIKKRRRNDFISNTKCWSRNWNWNQSICIEFESLT